MCQGCLNFEGNSIPHFNVHIPHYHKGYRSCIRAMYWCTVDAREVNFPSIQPQTQQSHSIIARIMLVYLNLVTATKGNA
jgi:hypothetical protein